ncbi:MAG: ABC transporter substrate-binding protein [Desulfobacterales bacterium]|nr:MAG: ABC transporter substrate-binding protein [Desulfobacterales bacterium]
MKSNLILFFLVALFIFDVPAAMGAENIAIGVLNDLSGATSGVGADYARGVAEAIRYINDEGGINGKKIELIQYDYGYRVQEVLAKYKFFKRQKVKAVLGWHIVDTESLSAVVARDKMPYLSASYAAHLTDPTKAPYNIFAATDDSSSARAALTAWFDEKWPAHKDYGKRRPRFQCAFMLNSDFSRAPIKAVKDQAELFGFYIGPDQDVSLFALDARNQVRAMKTFQPDLVWHGNTGLSVASTIRAAAAMDLGADHIVNNWAFDENFLKLAGTASEGVMGVAVCAFYGENAPLMDKVIEYSKKYNPGVPIDRRLVRTVQAWANVLALREALNRADSAGELSGENILKKGFETFRDFDIGLNVPPLTYTAQDHRISGQVPIYEVKNGTFQLVEIVDLKERWPDKWANEWFGW